MKFPDIYQCDEPKYHIRGMGFTSKDRTPGREIQDPDDVAYVIPEVPEGHEGHPRQGLRSVRFQLRGAGPPENPVLGGPIIAEHEYHLNNRREFTITYYGMNRASDQPGKKYDVHIEQYGYGQLKCCFIMSVKGRWPLNLWGRIRKLFTSPQGENDEQDEGRWAKSTWINMTFECLERSDEFILECREVGRNSGYTVPRFESQGDIADYKWKDVFKIGRTMGLEISHVAYLAWIATMWMSSLGWVKHANNAGYHKVPIRRF